MSTARLNVEKLRNLTSITDFGGISGTDCTSAIQLAHDYLSDLPSMSGVQGVLLFPRGQWHISSQLYIPSNVLWIGEGFNFASEIVLLSSFSGAVALNIDGTAHTGGYAFRIGIRDITINANAFPAGKTVLQIQDAYSIDVENVYIYNFIGKGIDIKTSGATVLDVNLRRVHVFGRNTTDATHGVHAQAGKTVRLDNCDIEGCAVGLLTENDANIEVSGIHSERNLAGIDHRTNSSGSLTITGGRMESPGASGTALTVRGDNLTVLGGRYIGNGGTGIRFADATTKPANVHLIGWIGDCEDTRNWATTNIRKDATGIHKTIATNAKQVADNVATTLYRMTTTYSGAKGGHVDVDLTAQLTGVPYSLYTARYRIAFAAINASSMQVTSVVEYGNVNVDGSGNYGLTVAVSASVTNLVMDIQITANSGGALGNGVAVDTISEATLWQRQDDGGSYLQAI